MIERYLKINPAAQQVSDAGHKRITEQVLKSWVIDILEPVVISPVHDGHRDNPLLYSIRTFGNPIGLSFGGVQYLLVPCLRAVGIVRDNNEYIPRRYFCRLVDGIY